MGNYQKSWQSEVGLNHVPAYQTSGQPYASGSVDASSAKKISFPYVTRWVEVKNLGATTLKVGFSQHGVRSDKAWTETLEYPAGTNFFRIGAHQSGSVRLELKIGELWLSGSDSVDVVAGLTSIKVDKTRTETGTSWSGSVGVG